MTLLLPALTDIRDAGGSFPYADTIEVPAGSGRIYATSYVDDVGKGFANEFRFAALVKINNSTGGYGTGHYWPTPIP